MKYIITESKIKQIILNYLNDYVYPNYSSGPYVHNFYKGEIKRYNSYTFGINDDEGYTYYGLYDNDRNVLEIYPWLSEKLSALFGDKWVPVFREWFEDMTGLEINKLIIY
jgi:hypothetical protein